MSAGNCCCGSQHVYQPGCVKRRGFLETAFAVAGVVYIGGLVCPVLRYLRDPLDKTSVEASVNEVRLKEAINMPIGTALYFKFANKPALLIRLDENKWVSFSAVCTHLGCTVQYQHDQQRIYCACHGGVYDPQTGKNIAGPPPRPLSQFTVRVEDDGLVVSRT